MKKIQEPPFKQNAIALGFTLGVHAIAIVGLLFLGLSKPPEQPKKLTTVLVKPEDLPQINDEQASAENQANEVQSQIVDQTLPENIPVVPPKPTTQQPNLEQQKAEQEKLAEQKRNADEAARAKKLKSNANLLKLKHKSNVMKQKPNKRLMLNAELIKKRKLTLKHAKKLNKMPN